MTRILVIGSGPAAAGVTLAALAAGDIEVCIVDMGEDLEPDKQTLLDEFGGQTPSSWPQEVSAQLTQQPQAEVAGELPQKRLFGSNYPFRDRGQLVGLTAADGGNKYTVSPAFGGFSNVWGAQIMPFSERTFDMWPVDYADLVPHYQKILAEIPFAGADDDYSRLFPLLEPADPLPRLSPPSSAALNRYSRHRDKVQARGVTVGEARLALQAPACIECGLCLTGCPHGLIYSSSHTLGPLIRKGLVQHRPGHLVEQVGEDEAGPWALARHVASGEPVTLRADRVFIACGGIGSTRLVAGSVRPNIRRIEMEESVQMVLPFLSARSKPDPRTESTFTLNQFNILVEYGRPGLDLAQFHMYPYNPAFEDALPGPIRNVESLKRGVLKRTVAALGYLPSWHSPKIGLALTAAPAGGLPAVTLSSVPNPATRPTLARVFSKLLATAPALDLWPGLPVLSLSGPAKSYHFGGSFPHVPGKPRPGALETDTLGRVAEWDRVHLVDGAVFPSVPATTFTLTVMANAHRIATRALNARI
jgi:choline dehydrogenase-like flavoprotein